MFAACTSASVARDVGIKSLHVSCEVLFTPPIRSAECISVIESCFHQSFRQQGYGCANHSHLKSIYTFTIENATTVCYVYQLSLTMIAMTNAHSVNDARNDNCSIQYSRSHCTVDRHSSCSMIALSPVGHCLLQILPCNRSIRCNTRQVHA